MDENETYSVTVEIWVKPLFRKARPKEFRTAWVAFDRADLYHQLSKHYEGQKWTLKQCDLLSSPAASKPQDAGKDEL